MKKKKKMCNEKEEDAAHRKGPWTLEEDTLLTNYISLNGEGRWNLLSKSSGLERAGKSCRLRWLNYLRPDLKRGNLTPQEQLLILELHSKLGNRWSKIAKYLPGRTDNEIKNYWRTRVQKQARQLNIDSNSHKFLEAVRSFLVPRLIHKMKDKPNTNTKAVPLDLLVPVLSDNVLSYDSGFNNMDCSTSMSTDHKKISKFIMQDMSDLENVGSNCLDGSRGSSSLRVSEANIGNLEISALQDYHMGSSTYEEDVTQDPVWNMDDIWQFKEYRCSYNF